MEPTPQSAKPAKFPTISRFCRALFSWKTLRRCLVGLAVLITLIALYYTEEGWRGKRAWENYRRQLVAQGVRLDLMAYVPPPAPDDQNFAMTPFLAPVLDFNPQPLQPGQSMWRDTNGWNRAKDFAQGITFEPGSKPGAGSVFPVFNLELDLEFPLRTLRGQSNSGVSAGPFSSRAAAAAEVLKAFETYNPVLDELRVASRRPYSRFNVDYAAVVHASILLPLLGLLGRIDAVLVYRASAGLAAGKTDAAFDDVELMLFLQGSVQSEPIVISHLVRLRMLQNTARVIREGLAAHAWSDQQLQKIEAELGGLRLLKDMERSLNAERAAIGNKMFELVRNQRPNYFEDQLGVGPWAFRLFPRGWTYFEQINYNVMRDVERPGFDAALGRVYPRIADKNAAEVGQLLAGDIYSRIWHHRLFSTVIMPFEDGVFQKFAAGQTAVDECAVACALERFHLANGKYPESLDALVPKFIAAVPHDVITGDPLKYHLTGDGQFIIYSVGWNETDDGGKIVMSADGKEIDATQGDWVWPAYEKK